MGHYDDYCETENAEVFLQGKSKRNGTRYEIISYLNDAIVTIQRDGRKLEFSTRFEEDLRLMMAVLKSQIEE